MMPVNVLVEGVTDEPVAVKLLKHVGLDVGKVYGRGGKVHLLKSSISYNKAAHFEPWFVLVDLDEDAQCPSQAVSLWMPKPSQGMCFRVVVRSIEAWLLADRENIARYLSVSLSKIPFQVEADSDPKRTLINIARSSRKGSIHEDIVPQQSSGARVGPLYVARLTDFVENYWEPDKGARQSESLRRCINALSTLASFES